MCYCTPNIRTPFCEKCNQVMYREIKVLKARIAELEAREAKLREALETCTEGVFRDNGFEVLRKDYDADLVREALSAPNDTAATGVEKR